MKTSTVSNPFLILLQMFPLAVTCGNTFVLKPSEKDPGDYDLLRTRVSSPGALPPSSSCFIKP